VGRDMKAHKLKEKANRSSHARVGLLLKNSKCAVQKLSVGGEKKKKKKVAG